MIVYVVLTILFSGTAALPQSRSEKNTSTLKLSAAVAAANPYSGKWTYRSYLNRPDIIVGDDAQKALDLIFGEGAMSFVADPGGKLSGTFDMGGGYVLDLIGTIVDATPAAPAVLQIVGIGRPGTPTDAWEYDYVGYLAWQWRNGVDQIPAIVGTVIRAKPHGQSKAGVVASFIATKQQ